MGKCGVWLFTGTNAHSHEDAYTGEFYAACTHAEDHRGHRDTHAHGYNHAYNPSGGGQADTCATYSYVYSDGYRDTGAYLQRRPDAHVEVNPELGRGHSTYICTATSLTAPSRDACAFAAASREYKPVDRTSRAGPGRFAPTAHPGPHW